jgi:hypothetical protein
MKLEQRGWPQNKLSAIVNTANDRVTGEVKKLSGQLYNVEFATFEAVKDPTKASKP